MNFVFITGDLVERALSIEPILKARAGKGDRGLIVLEEFILPHKSAAQAVWRIYRQSGMAYVVYKMVESYGLRLIAKRTQARAEGLVIPTLDYLADRYGLEVVRTQDTNSRATLEAVRSFGPDYIVSLGMQRLKSDLIALPEKGVLNVHLGLLPEYRGLGCYFWPVVEGVSETGSTVHYITDERFDVGDIVAKGAYRIEPGDTIQRLHLQNAAVGGMLLATAVERLERGEIRPIPQGPGAYRSFPTREAVSLFRRNGGRLIRLTDLVGYSRRASLLPGEVSIEWGLEAEVAGAPDGDPGWIGPESARPERSQ